jgi:pSer/pThr/pTyr-binding forkhead associated (FHA) protein
MTDPATIRWESLATIAGAFALAVWALRDPEGAKHGASSGDASAMRFRIRMKNMPARTVDALDGWRLGRGADCDVVLDEPAVSKHHARVHFDGRASIEDSESTNGTLVNGRRIAGATFLRAGDRIALGTAKIVFLGLVHRGPASPKG